MINIIEDFKAGVLREMKTKWVPVHWVFFDSETHTEEIDLMPAQVFSLGWTCYRDRWSGHWPGLEEWKFWEDEEKVCRYFHDLTVRNKTVVLVGHNIFFDLQACGFFQYFTDWKWKLEFIYDKGLTYILRCKKDKNTLTILSTTNWFDQSLKELGKKIGLEKGEVDFETVTREELKIYCRRDVEILVEAIRHYIKFIRIHRLGKFSMTKASQAFTAYRHRFMSHKITLHKKLEATLLERDAYMGGRVECFRLGEQEGGPFVALDVNSMYMFVMKIMEYPWEIVEWNVHMDLERYHDILKKYCVIAEVEIDTPEPAFAVRREGKTIFPVGNFVCFLCTTGMKYALEHEYIKKMIRVAVYRKANLFSEYVDYFHALRLRYKEDNDEVMELLTKYMENALYGKFAEKKVIRDEYEEFTGRKYWREEILNIDSGELTIITNLMNKVIVQYSEGEGDNAFSGLSAHITENARFVLWEIIQGIGVPWVLYCDTDSIIIQEYNLQRIQWPLSETELGGLKIQERSKRLYIGGAKNYRTDKNRKIKGIPGTAIEVAPDVFEFDVFRRQDAHLRQGQISGTQVSQVTRKLTHMYDKGIIHDDGRVTPFQLSLP